MGFISLKTVEKRMNILLVQAYLGKTEAPVFPLGLSCLASSIKGHNVKVFDPNVSEDYVSELSNMLKDFRPDVIGVSLRNIDSTNKRQVVFYYSYLKEIIDVIKFGPCRNSKLIIGGSGFSMFANEIMHDEQRIDYGVFLEGENTFPDLLNHIDSPASVRGIFFRENGKVIFTRPNNQVDLTAVPLPERNIIPLEPYLNIPEAIGIETKRGCALSCIYCIYGFLNGKNIRLREPVKVVDEIESLVIDMNVKSFTFVDSAFNMPLSHAEAICKEIIKRGLDVSWSAWFHENNLNKELIHLIKNAGCRKIILSPDGFSDDVLRKLGKTIKMEDILRVYDILKNVNGIEVCYNFFKNPPGQSVITFLKLMAFYIKVKVRMKGRVHFEFNSMRIEPHTPLFNIAVKEGLIKNKDNLLFPVYYTNKNSHFIEILFNGFLKILGK